MARSLHMPAAGDGLSASWARDVVEELRAQSLSVLPPLALSRTPSGTTLRILPSAASVAISAQTWDLSISGTTATCRRCLMMRSSIVALPAGYTLATWMEVELTATLGGSPGWLCAKLATATNAITLAFENPPTVYDESSSYIYRPLYWLTKTATGPWSVADVRNAPTAVAYV